MATEVRNPIQLEIGHVLFIDIVSYSKLLITEQSDHLQTLKQIVRGTEQFQRAKAEGKLIGLPTGDGGALVFRNSAEAPLLCAIEIAKALQQPPGSREKPQLRLRMGIHSGPVNEITDLNEQANIAGAGINIAQRVMDCGDAGHILLSQHVADDLEQYPQWRSQLHDLGECEVKHGVRVRAANFYTDEVGNPEVPEKLRQAKETRTAPASPVADAKAARRSRALIVALIIAAAAVAAAGAYIFSHRSGSKSSTSPTAAAVIPEKSIAVLPFENLSSDKENTYFADGIQDEILTRLSKIADLKVISRTSTQQYQSKPGNLSDIAKQLSVAHILEGSVQKSADSVRVNVQLIKAANDSHVWADIYDRKLTDIFSVESDIAKAITSQLRAHLTGQEEQVITARPTKNPEAYDAYLRGLACVLRNIATTPNDLAAQKYLKEAVRLDSQFALAWALLARVDAVGYFSEALPPTVALREEAQHAAETALTLQRSLGEAVMAKGYYHYYCLRDYDAAVRYFEQARQFLPNSSLIPESLAYIARRRGQWDQSEAYFGEAERLDPTNAILLTQHAFSYMCLRRFPEALRKLDQVLIVKPKDLGTLLTKIGIAQAQGDLSQASAILASLHPVSDGDDEAILAMQVQQAKLERDPAQIIRRLEEMLARPGASSDYSRSGLRSILGWMQDLAGDHAAAEHSWRQARSELEAFLKEQPEDLSVIDDLALTNAYLGDKAAALKLVELAMATLPMEKDAVGGPAQLAVLAEVAEKTGERDRAIAALEKLLSTPYSRSALPPLTPALLRLDPTWDSLRNDPRFQKLCESPQAK